MKNVWVVIVVAVLAGILGAAAQDAVSKSLRTEQLVLVSKEGSGQVLLTADGAALSMRVHQEDDSTTGQAFPILTVGRRSEDKADAPACGVLGAGNYKLWTHAAGTVGWVSVRDGVPCLVVWDERVRKGAEREQVITFREIADAVKYVKAQAETKK